MAEINVLNSIPFLLEMPSKRIWIDYDDDSDVMYISFRKPQKANDSELEENVIYHYRDKELVGVTVMNAKQYMKSGKKEEVKS